MSAQPHPHLTLVAGFAQVTPVPSFPTEAGTPPCVPSVSPARLSADVVVAALSWAAEVDAVERDHDDLPGPLTPVEFARRRLLDAVHTMEYHAASASVMRVRR